MPESMFSFVDECNDMLRLDFSSEELAILAEKQSMSPDTMKINVVTPGGQTSYTVPIIKVQQYSLDELFDKKLLFFLPFYIFSHEKELPECDVDEAKLEQLKATYRNIRSRLDDLQQAGEIDDFVKNAICSMSNHVMALIAQKYENVRKGVEHIMGGKIIEYEAKTILNKGRDEGKVEIVLEMLKEKQPLDFISRVSKYSKEKIAEIGRLHGVL